MRTHLAAAAVTLLLAALCGCGGSTDGPDDESVQFDQQLNEELIAMAEADQEGAGTAEERQDRLAEILDEHGWPGHDLVGEEGSSAAWLIAQHADLDIDLQERALELLADSVAKDDASPGDLAYLTDRVAVARGEPQTYGTQIRCEGRKPVPPTPIDDPEAVEELRAEAGLEPLEDYLEQMTRECGKG